jgi:predicted Zn-dependent peptidase
LSASAPELPAPSALGATSVTLDSGARVELREVRGDQLALAVRFDRGGLPEPPAQHGQSALLSLLTATACAGLEPAALEARLHALGARIEPLVDAGGHGIVLTASLARWAEAVDLGLSCALRPSLERRHLSTARLRLFERLGSEGGPGELRAAVAELLSPATPAAIAPWGNPVRQASVSLPDLRALHAQSARAAALRVAVVAPIARDALLAAVVRRLAGLGSDAATPAGRNAAAKAAASPEPPARTTLAHAGRAELPQPTLGLSVWRAAGQDPTGADGFAALAHAAIARLPGIVVTWHDAGQNGSEAWAAVAMTGPPEALLAAQGAVSALGGALTPASLDAAADAACAEHTERAARKAATPAAEALALVADAPPPAPAPASPIAARALAQALSRARPTFLPLR